MSEVMISAGMKVRPLCLLAALAAMPWLSFGQGSWITAKTRHFQMYTTCNQAFALQQLQDLENVHSFFAAARPFGDVQDDPKLQVIAFQSKGEYSNYAFRAVGGGYYLRTSTKDYVLFADMGAGNRELLSHELTHFVVMHSGLTLPVWLNEGIAELYSTLDASGKQVTVGHPPAGHLGAIRRLKWMPWDELFRVDVTSPQYNEGDKVSVLYIQSWALSHMLAMEEQYSGHFKQFLQAVSAGQRSEDALQSTYHKSMAQIDADLAAYVARKALPETTLDFTPEPSGNTAAISQTLDFDIQFALADVHSARPQTASDGYAQLAAVSDRYPQRPEPEEALALLAFQQGRKEEAKKRLAIAIQRNSQDAETYYQYAALQQDAGVANVELYPLFRKAIELQPSFDRARVELALLDYQSSDFEAAIASLTSLKVLPAGMEYEVDFALGQSYFNTDHLKEARSYAEKAAKEAGTTEEKRNTAELLSNVARDEGTTPVAARKTTPNL